MVEISSRRREDASYIFLLKQSSVPFEGEIFRDEIREI